MDTPVKAPVHAVVFDVGRVIVRWNLRHLFAQLIDDPKQLDWFCANVVTEAWHFEADQGRDLADMVAERVALFPDHADLIEAYRTRFLDTIPGTVKGTSELIDELATRQVPLFGITNFGAEFWGEFRPTMPLFDHFTDIVVSGVEKLVKPNRAIFDLAVKRFGYAPSQMLFIDDNLDNIESARALGWQVHHFIGTDAGGLRDDLCQRGLISA